MISITRLDLIFETKLSSAPLEQAFPIPWATSLFSTGQSGSLMILVWIHETLPVARVTLG
jgi:hypothetical protein